MSEGMNRVMLLGNLGADPDLRFGQGADSGVLKLRLATTESYFDKKSNERKERTDWHSVVVFGRRAEALQKILSKGSGLMIEGRLQTSSYEKDGEKRYSTEVVATNVILVGGKRDGAQRDDAPASAQRPAYGGGGGFRAPAPAAPRGGTQTEYPEPDYDDGDPDGLPF